MTDLERLLPDGMLEEAYRLAAWARSPLDKDWQKAKVESYAAMRQSLAPAFEQAKEDGRREMGLHDATCQCEACGGAVPFRDVEAPPAAAAPEQTPEDVPIIPGELLDMAHGDRLRFADAMNRVAAGAPSPAPAVPERAETPPYDNGSTSNVPLIDWESRCRTAEAALTKAQDEAGTQAGMIELLKLSRNRAEAELTETRAARERSEQALRWVTNIMCGVSKDGGSDISQQEFRDAIDAAKAALTTGGPEHG